MLKRTPTLPLEALNSRWRRWQSRWHSALFQARGIEIGRCGFVGPQVAIELGFSKGSKGRVCLAERVTLETGVILAAWGGEIEIAENVFIGPYTVVYGHGGVEIGSNTLIAMHCRVLSSNHSVPEPSIPIRSQPDILLPVQIGEDVWLGAGVTVLGGVTIGKGCVVGAGAVVTKDLPAGAIALGVPARIVGDRSWPCQLPRS